MATDVEGIGAEALPSTLPFTFVNLGATIVNLARALEEPVDAKGQWINNVNHRGASGTVTAQHLRGILPSAVPSATAVVQMWVGNDNLVRRIRIEGSVAPNDPLKMVRVLDLSDMR